MDIGLAYDYLRIKPAEAIYVHSGAKLPRKPILLWYFLKWLDILVPIRLAPLWQYPVLLAEKRLCEEEGDQIVSLHYPGIPVCGLHLDWIRPLLRVYHSSRPCKVVAAKISTKSLPQLNLANQRHSSS